MDPFSALNLVFLIPLAVGLLFAVGSALGLGADHDIDGDHDLHLEGGHDAHLELEAEYDVHADIDADMDGHADLDADVDTDHSSPTDVILDSSLQASRRLPLWIRLLGFLGFGRVPITIVLMVGLLVFGGIGICGNIVLGPAGFVLSLVGALVGSFVLTGAISSVVGRLIPSMETSAVSRHQLCGKVASVSLVGQNGFVMAHVHDESGTLHQIACSVDDVSGLKKGDGVIVVSYDGKSCRYLVEPAAPYLLPKRTG